MKIRKLMATAAAVAVASTGVIHGATTASATDSSVSSKSSHSSDNSKSSLSSGSSNDDKSSLNSGSSKLDELSSKATGSLPSSLKAIVDYILNFPKVVKNALSSGNSSRNG